MNIFFRIADAAKVIFHTRKGISFIMKNGASIASTQVLHNCRHYIPELKTVLDVGANKGQFALATAWQYPAAKIYAFEPVPGTFKTLQHNTRRVPAVQAFNYALGSDDGVIDFFSNAYSHASSALQVSALQRELVPRTADTFSIKVVVRQMDNVLKDLSLTSPTLLKLDVQGFEKEVLLGAAHSLQHIDYLLFETSFVAMYDGEPLFDEMHDYVKKLGFEFIAPVSFLQSGTLQILQMDLLYKRKS
ncbi:FkbM family methyltransferase [Chitinophaga sp. 22321]|uniref:FkbM family methyltransferase n=1 Tax=Chitinophaga hostae TaxID=2831022 RepID=A0ABS5J6V2_9BACT|nr:FkbM family methyltransferase [Chitinophaga hostae]MBS0030805.1 FkbM family methyltransferase [Chitinophaga hostae]